MCMCIPESEEVQVNLIGGFSDDSEFAPPLDDIVKAEENADVKMFELFANKFDRLNIFELDATDDEE